MIKKERSHTLLISQMKGYPYRCHMNNKGILLYTHKFDNFSEMDQLFLSR